MARHHVVWTIGIFAQVAFAFAATAQAATWDMTADKRFDPTNKAYPIKQNQVVVDLTRDGSLCPTGLGHLASGCDTVNEIHILYKADAATEQWLQITWNPGGSGTEQFEVFCNDKSVGKSKLVDGAKAPYQDQAEVFWIATVTGRNTVVLKRLGGDGLRFSRLALADEKVADAPAAEGGDSSQKMKPTLKYPTLASFEKAIGQPAVLLDSDHVMLLAPKSREAAARIVFPYLVRAYDELYKIVGVHTKYKIVVYTFPKGHPEATGGTSLCTIRYDDSNLDLETSQEWTRYKVPHVSGFIEEMAHNFVDATGVQFGWEMVGWSIGVKATQKVAPNPIFARSLAQTRKTQADTFRRYKAAANTFPADIESNLCDRIHAFLLWQAELRYGPEFWPDFFNQVRDARATFAEANKAGGDENRNARYRVTVACFDKLPKLDFKKILSDNGISLTTDVKSLRPTDAGWNRKLQ